MSAMKILVSYDAGVLVRELVISYFHTYCYRISYFNTYCYRISYFNQKVIFRSDKAWLLEGCSSSPSSLEGRMVSRKMTVHLLPVC